MDTKVKSPSSLNPANDLVLSGLLIGKQNDNITYTSKKTGTQVEAKRDVLILQTSFGIVICRSFQQSDGKSSAFVDQVNVGDTLHLPVTSYAVENGLKCANVRVN